MSTFNSTQDMLERSLSSKGKGFISLYRNAILELYVSADPVPLLINITNYLPYVKDDARNEWRAPADTLKNGGDCEDMAILLFFMLHAIVQETNSTLITDVFLSPVVHELYGNHMVLLYKFKGETRVADTSYLKDGPKPLKEVKLYKKFYYLFNIDHLHVSNKVKSASHLLKWTHVKENLLNKLS